MPTWCCLVCDFRASGTDFDVMESGGWLSEWRHDDHVDAVCPRCHQRAGFVRGVTLRIEPRTRRPGGLRRDPEPRTRGPRRSSPM